METRTAVFVRKITPATGDMRLYRLSPPMGDNEYVAVSATVVMFSGPETYIFPADAEGNVTDWGELAGSYKGGLNHAEALSGAGYAVAS